MKRALIPLGFLISLHPFVSSAVALAMGVFISLLFGNPYISQTRKFSKKFLAYSIVGLGAGVNLMLVLKTGLNGILFTFFSLSLTLLIGYFMARCFKLDRETSTLINVGTAICGGSAIAAVSTAIRAKDESISIALGIVFILNAVALFVFPQLGHLLGLSENQFGLWSALAIHDTSSVVGASMQYGPHALEIATTVKLVRALWIIPVTLFFTKLFSKKTDQKKSVQYPWFIGGFVLVSAIVTFFPELQNFGHQIEWIAKRFLVATLFLIGTGLTLESLKKVGAPALFHGVCLWVLVATGSLFAIYWGIA